MTSQEIAGKQVRCPACGGASLYAPSNPHRPFCCQRCKSADLGAWASERFTLPETQPETLSDTLPEPR